MRKTKIICTIGPASENEEILTRMCRSGMNVARLNFSHGTHAEHQTKIDLIKQVREKLNLPIAIMLDTKGPEYRIGAFKDGKITVEEGSEFTFTTEDIVGDETRVSVNYKGLVHDLDTGDRILVNNGLVIFEVTKIDGCNIVCKVISGGTLSSKKSMSFPNKTMTQEYLSEVDKSDLLFGIKNDVDFVAASFISCEADIRAIRNFLDENGGEDIDIIAKIENRAGVDNIDEICKVADGVMVARGDLGVEIPFVEVPAVQKHLIKKCRMLGKRVITATEMLESMITNARPTRAEISDIANAVYDGTSAIMLSGETAAGKYPVQAVATMAKIAETTEESIDYKERFHNAEFKIKNMVDAISHSTCGMAIDIRAKAIVACSLSGMTARMVSRFRAPVDIIGLTTNENTWRKLALSWGVIPAICEKFTSTDVLFYTAKKIAVNELGLNEKDRIVITGGDTTGFSGNTNLIKIEEV